MSSKPRERWRGHSLHRKPGIRAICRASSIEPLENRLYLTTAAYTWENVNIGAGGFVDGIFYDPHNQNTIYARTDIGGLYKTTNDGSTWTQLLDFVGNNTGGSGNGTQSQEIGCLSFAIDPENSNNIYADVGEYSGTNGAVFYSTNGGQTWGQTNLSFYVGGNSNGRGDGEQIQVDPNDSNIVFLGSNNDGLWESTNAGHSFSKINSFTPSSTTFVLFNTAGTVGSPSQTIYVGDDSASANNTSLYETTNGGTSWAQITGTGTAPSGYLPGHAVLSNGYLYLGYANAETPGGTLTGGGVYRYNISSSVWANISPVAASGWGYDGVAADPENPNTIVVASFNDYGGPDTMWRTVNANAATPTWYKPLSTATAQDSGYGGFNQTRNASSAPYAYDSGDGISNWVGAIAINPFNSNQLMYGTGEGIWATNNLSNGGANTTLTAANSWYFPNDGIEFTAVGGVATASAGVPLFSAMGDIFGFAHTTLTFSPAQGAANYYGSANNVDDADNVIAIVGAPTSGKYGAYSTNDGQTFQVFPNSPGTDNNYGNDTVAVSANGSTIVWAQSGQAPYYSTNDGTTWTASGGGMAANGQIIADRLNASDFYYHVGADVYFSSNGGVSFNLETASAPSGGDMTVNPFVTGDLWIAASGGLYHSSNFGATVTEVNSSLASTNGVMALGAPAPGQTTPAIYVFGTIGSFLGVYRSDDGGSTWVQLNDVNHQWGGILQTFAADPKVFGRLYIGINGRGIIMGNPTSSLPANWVDTDIYTPGNPGWATSSTTLSTGTTVNNWILDGGGAGLTGSTLSITSLTDTTLSTGPWYATAVTATANGLHVGDLVTISGATSAAYDGTFAVSAIVNSTTFEYIPTAGLAAATGTITESTNDQFNFAYEPISGSVAISAQLLSLTNADEGNGTPLAGVMVRSSTDDNDRFAAMVQTAGNSLVFEYRTTTGGAVSAVSLASVPVGSEYVEIVRSGSSFGGYYSSNGASWTQLGTTVSIAAMPATANVGLAATANYNSQLTSATFANVTVGFGPSIVNAAAANPNPVTGTSTALSALGSEDGSGSGLTYTWSYTGPTGVTYSGNTNGTNAAQNITANFTQAGSYNFTATITDASNYSTPTSIAVTVNQTVTSIAVNPNTATIGENSNQQFSATAYDQFSNALSSQPTFTWSVTSGIGSVNSSGLYSSPASLGSATVQAASGSVQGSASVTIAAAPTVAQAAAANPSPVTGTSTALSVLGADNGGESNLTYTWSYTGPTGVTYTGNTNGTNAAQNITADFTQPGSYNFTATITDSIGLFTTSTVNVTVQQTATNIVVSPSSTPVVPVGFTQQFSAAATDQFGNSISSPSFGWAITGSGNSIDGTGDATLGSTPGTFTVTASSGSAQGTANVIAENFAVPAGSTLDVNLGTAGPVALSASGGNLTASQNGVQITLSGFTGVTVTDTASSDVLNFNGPVALP
ncbi:MAG: hypothetical protein ABSD28_18665, partial [Tepidisphaeraceae bacterium]